MTTDTTGIDHPTLVDPGDDDDHRDDNDRWRVALVTPDRDVAHAPAARGAGLLGVFDAANGIVFKHGPVLVKLDRFGTLPDGRVLLTINDTPLLPTGTPRPGDEGA